MRSRPLPGWGFEQVGWLLQEVTAAGGIVPSRYHCASDEPEEWERVRKARIRLGQTINLAFTHERLVYELGSEAKARSRLKALRSIEGQLGRALRAFDADPALSAWVTGEMLRPQPQRPNGSDDPAQIEASLNEVLAGMRHLRDVAKSLGRSPEGAPLSGLGSPQDVLLSRLAAGYRKGMDADPIKDTVNKNNDYRGPFPAFVRAAYHLAGRGERGADALTQSILRYVKKPAKSALKPNDKS